jgi:anti-sigma factor RsiW
MTCDEAMLHLHAYVDRELDSAAHRSIRDHLHNCLKCRGHVTELEALSQAIRTVPIYSAPDRLRAEIVARVDRRTAVRRWAAWGAAAAVLLSVGAGIDVARVRWTQPDAMLGEVVDSHVRSLMADHLFDVESTNEHTVKPWFAGKVDFSPRVIDLSAIGFPLVGGRVDVLQGRPAAALVYMRRQHRINVFILPEDGRASSAVTTASVRGFHIHHWTRDGMGFWAVSDVDDSELMALVRAIQES